MKRFILIGGFVAAVLVVVFGSNAGANVVTPGTATIDCSAAHISLAQFSPGDHVVTATGMVNTTPWTAHATLHGASGRLTFEIPDSLVVGTGLQHLTFDTVRWADHPLVHLADISVTKRCHEVTTTTTKPTTSTTKPMTTTTTGHITVTTAPKTPPPSVTKTTPPSGGGTLPFTGRDQMPLVVGAIGTLAVGILLILRAREMKQG